MKKLSGFSLMEMMVVLLIVSVIAGATAPMINKKLMTAASEKSPWVWIGQGTTNIGYNVLGKTYTAAIGTMSKPNTNPRLYIESTENPHIELNDGNSNKTWKISTFANSFSIIPSNLNQESGDNNAIVIGGTANNGATAVGFDADATADNAIALGRSAKAGTSGDGFSQPTGVNSIAIGYEAKVQGTGITLSGGNPDAASATSAIAIGHNSVVSGGYGIAIGGGNSTTSTRSWNSSSIAIGRGTDALGENSIAMGYNAAAACINNSVIPGQQPTNAVAIGYSAKARFKNSIAMGSDAVAGTEANQNKTSAIAIGHNSEVKGDYGIAIGGGNSTTSTRSWNSSSIAIGRGTDALAQNSIAIGYNAAAGTEENQSETSAIAIGHNSKATGEYGIAIGHEAKATASGSLAIGSSCSYTIGNTTYTKVAPSADHKCSVAIGPGAKTTQNRQIVLGDETTAVYIPGNLYVGKASYLGTRNLGDEDSSNVYIRFGRKNPDKLSQLRVEGGGTDSVDAAGGYHLGEEYGYTTSSDRRLKNVGKAFKGGLEEIKKLEVFNYTFKKDKSKTPRVGVMAQDLEKIFPSAVTKGEDGFLRIRMEDMFYALVNAVKELDTKFDLLAQKQKKIDELEDKVYKLELENKEFAKRLLELEKKIK